MSYDYPNIIGKVIFEDIYEDKYTLYATAAGHSSYSAVILVSPDNTVREIFLQRTTVTYTWTVTPTTVTDVYEITLDSTFETFVSLFSGDMHYKIIIWRQYYPS